MAYLLSSINREHRVVKFKYEKDIRKFYIGSVNNFNYEMMVERFISKYNCDRNSRFTFVYQDTEMDWITISNDEDVALALMEDQLTICVTDHADVADCTDSAVSQHRMSLTESSQSTDVDANTDDTAISNEEQEDNELDVNEYRPAQRRSDADDGQPTGEGSSLYDDDAPWLRGDLSSSDSSMIRRRLREAGALLSVCREGRCSCHCPNGEWLVHTPKVHDDSTDDTTQTFDSSRSDITVNNASDDFGNDSLPAADVSSSANYPTVDDIGGAQSNVDDADGSELRQRTSSVHNNDVDVQPNCVSERRINESNLSLASPYRHPWTNVFRPEPPLSPLPPLSFMTAIASSSRSDSTLRTAYHAVTVTATAVNVAEREDGEILDAPPRAGQSTSSQRSHSSSQRNTYGGSSGPRDQLLPSGSHSRGANYDSRRTSCDQPHNNNKENEAGSSGDRRQCGRYASASLDRERYRHASHAFNASAGNKRVLDYDNKYWEAKRRHQQPQTSGHTAPSNSRERAPPSNSRERTPPSNSRYRTPASNSSERVPSSNSRYRAPPSNSSERVPSSNSNNYDERGSISGSRRSDNSYSRSGSPGASHYCCDSSQGDARS